MEHSTSSPHRRFLLYGLLTALAVLTSSLLSRNIDFSVYWYGAGRIADRSRALYGPASGVGFPMNYRYPPLTYLLLWPLSRLPLYWAGFTWMVGAWTAAVAAVVLTVHTVRLRFSKAAVVAASAYMLAYVVLAIRSGNVQPYLIAMILAAIVLSDSRGWASAFLLALAISFKVWPVFFLPCFVRRQRRAVLVRLIPAMLLLWVAPLLLWSPFHYLDLIRQWYDSEFQSAIAYSELWYFPGQSLRGVLLRYLTASSPWINGFPDVHLTSLSPATVVVTWAVVASLLYLAAFIAMLQSDTRKQWVWDGLFFALFSILQPFCLKSSMISLGPAVLVAAALCSEETRLFQSTPEKAARLLFFAACGVSLCGAVLQYKPLLRLLLALGLDFYAALLLVASLLLWALRPVLGNAVSAGAE
jgi:hypothetical protein